MTPLLPDCPICLPSAGLESVALDGPIGLWRCGSCRGAWARLADVAALRTAVSEQHPVLALSAGRRRCRTCSKPLAAGACEIKNHPQIVFCRSCDRAMDSVQLDDVAVDVCRPCHAAWFDEGELGAIVRRHAGRLPLPATAAQGFAATRPRSFLAHGVPADLSGAVDAAVVAGEAVGGLARVAPEAVGMSSTAFEAAGRAAIEGVSAGGEAAVSVVEAVFTALASIFEGL